jgi:hypothetical protein
MAFADTSANDSTGKSLVTAIAAVITALIAGLIALWNNRKVNENAVDIQDVKSGVDRDLERLKVKLEHGQLINSTQWNAEFEAYQALWKSIVPVRAIAHKLVMRESELAVLGLEVGDVSEADRIKNLEQLLHEYAEAVTGCMLAINEHAPFYAVDIRKKANEAHVLAHAIFTTSLAARVARMKGMLLTEDQANIAEDKRRKELNAFFAGVDDVEEMIRKRLEDVQVFNPVTA